MQVHWMLSQHGYNHVLTGQWRWDDNPSTPGRVEVALVSHVSQSGGLFWTHIDRVAPVDQEARLALARIRLESF